MAMGIKEKGSGAELKIVFNMQREIWVIIFKMCS